MASPIHTHKMTSIYGVDLQGLATAFSSLLTGGWHNLLVMLYAISS